MKCSYLFLLYVALVSAVHAAPPGQNGADSDEYGSPRTQGVERLQRVIARSNELQPRLAYLPLIPGFFAAADIAKQRKARKERERQQPKRDLDFIKDVRASENNAGNGLQRRQTIEHDAAIVTRSDDLQPRLVWVPLWGALRDIDKKQQQQQQRKDGKQRKRDLGYVYDARDFIGREDFEEV